MADAQPNYPIMSDEDVGLNKPANDTGLPQEPQVPHGAPYPTYSDDQVGIVGPKPPSVLRQIIDPSSAIDNALPSGSLYQSVKNIANAFGEALNQTGDDISKDLYSKGGGDLVESMKKSGMFQPYIEDQNDFNKGAFYKTVYPAIHNMIATSGEAVTRGLAATGNIALLPMNTIGGALGQATEEIPEGGVKELAQYAMNSPLLAETHLPVKDVLESLPSQRVPRPVAEGEASGIVGTTEGQNAGVEPLTENQHVRQTVAESEVNPVRAAEPITETPTSENDIHTNARILDPETFTKYDQLADTRDDLRKQLSDMDELAKQKVFNSDERDARYNLQQKIQETNAGMRELAPKVSDAYLQAQQFEKAPESVLAGEVEKPTEAPLDQRIDNLREERDKTSDPKLKDVLDDITSPFLKGEQTEGIGTNQERTYDPMEENVKWALANGRSDLADIISKRLDRAAELSAQQEPGVSKEHPKYQSIKDNLTKIANEAKERADRVRKIVGDSRRENPSVTDRGGELAVEPLTEQKGELAERDAVKVSPITEDITQKLIATGQNADEARASAEVATRMYQYFADVYGGEKGTAQDWYAREGADIKGAKERATVLAQPGKGGAELKQDVTEYPPVYRRILEVSDRLPDSAKPKQWINRIGNFVGHDAETAGDLVDLHNWLESKVGSTGKISKSDILDVIHDINDKELNQTTKGKIRLAANEAKAVISLTKNADASTFVHESAHHFLDMMDRFSKEDEAPQALKDDMQKIRKWTGLSEKPYETPKEKKSYVQAQEKFARGFERYLMEGVAPNRDMALIFAKFKSWLASIYRSVASIPNQKGGINEDVRSFFDRVMSSTPERTVIATNHPTELGLKANIESPRLGDLFGTVPKAPQTLTEWLAKNGGIKDDGTGDLSAMDATKSHIDARTGKAKPFASKLVKADGMDLDTAARAAQEAGYFPEKGDERPTIEELKGKLLEDLTDNKQYSDKDHEALRNHQEALKYNAQVDQISHETGLDPAGKTHDQFFDEVNQYYEDEKRYNEARDMASKAEEDYADYERKEREFIESRGDAWEPPKEPEHATLEDLENERKQEQAANDAASSAANAQGPQRAAGVGESGEAGVRQGGGGAEPDGSAGPGQGEADARELAARQQLDAARANIADTPVGDTSAPEPKPATRPNEPTGKSEFYDKAGNVRLDLLTDSDSIKAAMREAAEKNPQIFNHGIITDAQVAEFADAMGADAKNLNIQKLRQLSIEDDIPLAARIRAGSKLMVDALNHSLELMNKENPTDEDVAKFLEAKNQFLMIAETVSATTNEMGRGFRAYNNLMKEYNVTDIHEAAELFQKMTGGTLDQIKAEMKAGSALKTPKQVAKFTQDSLKPDFMDKLIEYRNNSLLSGPTTHTMYTVGGFLNAAYKPLQTLAGVAVQGIREALGSEITERMYAREALEQFHALSYGSMRGLMAAKESWRNNSEVALPGEIKAAPLLAPIEGGLKDVKGTGWFPRNQAISGKFGTAINVPSRFIGSIHSFLKVLGYEQNKAGLVVRDALDKGFDPKTDEYTKFVSDGIDNPTSKIMEASGKETLKGVYREKVDWNSTPGKLFNVLNSNPVTKILFPFVKMQYNIKRLAFRDNSVLGFLDPSVRADVAGINGDVAKNMAIGKIAAGTAIAGLGVSMTMQGLNNGGGPSDPKAYKTWRLTHTPYAVQVGSIVIPHKALGTWGQLLGWSADMAEGAHEFDPKDIEKSSWHFVRKAGAIFTEEGFLTQAKNTLDAAFTPEQFGTRFIQNFATQWLPFSTGFSQNRLLNDPYARRVKSLGAENLWGVPESMEYKYPGTSELLQPMRDMFGQPVTFSSSYDKYANDRVVQKLESLQTGIGRLSDKIKGVQLTEQQYDDYSRVAGQMTYARLSKVVSMSGFDRMPPQHQMQIIEKTTSECRLLAANTVMKMNPDIMRQASAKKRLSIYGNQEINNAEEDVNNP